MKLGDYLKTNSIKPVAFAKTLGISQSHLSLLVSGGRGASIALIQRISAATDGAVSFEDWLSPEESPSPASAEVAA